MRELMLKLAVLATEYDKAGSYNKAAWVDRLLELIATANSELQTLEDELIEE